MAKEETNGMYCWAYPFPSMIYFALTLKLSLGMYFRLFFLPCFCPYIHPYLCPNLLFLHMFFIHLSMHHVSLFWKNPTMRHISDILYIMGIDIYEQVKCLCLLVHDIIFLPKATLSDRFSFIQMASFNIFLYRF